MNKPGETAHILPDILEPGLSVVFCGSAAGAVSAAKGAYYAGPGNGFWRILAETRLTPRELTPEEFRTLPRYGIGLTDMAKTVSGSDASLPRAADDPAGLTEKIGRYAPAALAFVGKRAAQVWFRDQSGKTALDYGRQGETIGAAAIFVLPSTSGAARRYWDTAPWYELAGFLAERRTDGS